MRKLIALTCLIALSCYAYTQNVGIGTATPIAKLEVWGNGTTNATNAFVLRQSNGDTILRIRDDGRIGIGYNGSNYGRTLNLGGIGINFYMPNEGNFGGSIYPTDTTLVLYSDNRPNNAIILNPDWGNVGVGTRYPKAKFHVNSSMIVGPTSTQPATGYELSVRGDIIAENVVTQPYSVWPDYVFEDNYKLMPLAELEESIRQHKHLPGIASAREMEESDGVNHGKMILKLLEKVEELTLYVIDLKKENDRLREEMSRKIDK